MAISGFFAARTVRILTALIASGFLSSEAGSVEDALRAAGLAERRRLDAAGWVALIAEAV